MRKITGLIGYPLGHTLSPAMHNAAFQALGLDWQYQVFETPPGKLEERIAQLRADSNVVGFNVTIPYKEKIIPLLDELKDFAQSIGAVNTVVKKDTRLIGYNTDAPGFIESLKHNLADDVNQISLRFVLPHKKVVVLGAGGASRAVCAALAGEGVAAIALYDIDTEKAADLCVTVNKFYPPVCRTITRAALADEIANADLLVNCTPIGMHPKVDASPLPENIYLPSNLLVYDLVYNPLKTKLLQQAELAGCQPISGLEMLVHQGALAFGIWTGKQAPLKIMFNTAKFFLK